MAKQQRSTFALSYTTAIQSLSPVNCPPGLPLESVPFNLGAASHCSGPGFTHGRCSHWHPHQLPNVVCLFHQSILYPADEGVFLECKADDAVLTFEVDCCLHHLISHQSPDSVLLCCPVLQETSLIQAI